MPTFKELQKIAKKLNIKGRHSMRKAKLELAISSHKVVNVRKASRKRKKSRRKSRKVSRKKSRKVSKKSRKKSRKVSRKTQPKNGLATLSIKQPAAALILYRGKNVENRSKPKFREKFINKPQWVLIQTGQQRQKKSMLSCAQLESASQFKKVKFVDTADVMDGVDQTTGSIVGAMLVSEQRPANKKCASAWAGDNEVHIMIKKTIAFSKPQKWKGQLCVFPVAWDQLNTTIKKQLNGIKGEFLMRGFPISRKTSRKKSRKVSRKKSRKVSRKKSRKRKVSRKKSRKRKVSRKKSRKRKVSRKKSRKFRMMSDKPIFEESNYEMPEWVKFGERDITTEITTLYRSNEASSCSKNPFLGPTIPSVQSYVKHSGILVKFNKMSGKSFILRILTQKYLNNLVSDKIFKRYFNIFSGIRPCVFKQWTSDSGENYWLRDSNDSTTDCKFYTDLFKHRKDDFIEYDGIYTHASNFTENPDTVPAECVLKEPINLDKIRRSKKSSENWSSTVTVARRDAQLKEMKSKKRRREAQEEEMKQEEMQSKRQRRPVEKTSRRLWD